MSDLDVREAYRTLERHGIWTPSLLEGFADREISDIATTLRHALAGPVGPRFAAEEMLVCRIEKKLGSVFNRGPHVPHLWKDRFRHEREWFFKDDERGKVKGEIEQETSDPDDRLPCSACYRAAKVA